MTSVPTATEGFRWKPSEPPRETVLVVDDVDLNLLAVEALLEDMGCAVMTVRSGQEALRRLLHHEFALMLLDVQMPDMDGYEVAFHAQQNPATREVPIIFLTASFPNEDNVLRGYGTGCVDFLFKPVNPTILRGKVRVFLDLYRSRHQISEAKLALERSNAELERAYRDLQATQAQLVQSAKMASLGELVAGVAHEINNPLAFAVSHLTTARSNLDRVREATVIPEACLQNWERAENRLSEMGIGLTRIQELVVKLRTFSRLDEGEWKHASVRECVDSLLTILGHRLKDRVHVEARFGEPEVIHCIPSLLNQALMNLVTNAIDAVGERGSITIDARGEGELFVIEVSDTGHGIPEAIRERVLEPFFTTKPVGQGTGLGLSITYAIVKKHDGSLELGEAPGGGTRAVVRLPLNASK